jgi:uncharacterized protein YndB with AHSA1/START domain
LFEVLTEHEHLKKWSSPKNFDVTFSQGQLKAGGEYSYGMKSGDGPEFVMAGEYKEIVRPDRLAYTQSRVGAPGPETEISMKSRSHLKSVKVLLRWCFGIMGFRQKNSETEQFKVGMKLLRNLRGSYRISLEVYRDTIEFL